MNKKIGLVFPLFLMFCLLLSPVHALYASWNGYVYINNSLASSGTRVSAHINNASTATAVTNTGTVKSMPNNQSYYIIDLECASGTNVSLKVWDIWSNVVDQTCTGGWHTNGTNYFNLSVTTLSNGNNCTYGGSCNSSFCVDGYCCNEACDGANEDCNVTGSEGTCTSTATTETTVPGGEGEGEGEGEAPASTTTTTPATTAPTTAETTVPTTTTINVTTTIGPAPGCPILKVYDGKDFVEIKTLDIHAPEGVDVKYTTTFNIKPVDGKILLTEASYLLWEGSHIDSVTLTDDKGEECQLISAEHSKYGNVLEILAESDDIRIETKPREEIALTFEGCSGSEFSFTIEGYNKNPRAIKLEVPVVENWIVIGSAVGIISVIVVVIIILARRPPIPELPPAPPIPPAP